MRTDRQTHRHTDTPGSCKRIQRSRSPADVEILKSQYIVALQHKSTKDMALLSMLCQACSKGTKYRLLSMFCQACGPTEKSAQNTWQKFSKVSALVHLQHKDPLESTFLKRAQSQRLLPGIIHPKFPQRRRVELVRWERQ
jgi:hypothetical protein